MKNVCHESEDWILKKILIKLKKKIFGKKNFKKL